MENRKPILPHPLLKAEEIAALLERAHVHQFNPNAIRHTKSLGDLVGLTQFGIHLVRVEPGHDTTQYHVHHNTEELIYILAGKGIAEIGNEKIEVGLGDFMGFVAGHLAHSMSNPFDKDLIYLMGGNRRTFDVCDYPRIEKWMYIVGGKKEYVEWHEIKPV